MEILRIKIFIYTLLLFVTVQNLYGQAYNYRNFTTNDGILSSEVYQVFQDSKGYIWFASDNGVSRYDGYHFKNYSVNQGLPDNTVFEIYEDWKGRIWFITFSARLSYLENDSIYTYKHNQLLLSAFERYPISTKLSFYVDKENAVYFSEEYNGVIKISDKGEVSFLDGKYLFQIKDKRVLVNRYRSSGDSIYILFNNSERKIKHKPKYLYGRKSAITIDSSIFFSAGNILYKIKDSGCKQIHKLGSTVIWLSSFDNDLWVGTEKGAFCYSINDSGSIPKYKLLSNYSVSSILKDNEGGMWFSTLENGVFYLPNLSIKSITSRNSNLASKVVTRLLVYDGNIMCGLVNGKLLKYKNNTFSTFFEIENNNSCGYVNDIIYKDDFIYLLTFCSTYAIQSNKANKSENSSSKDFHNLLLEHGGKRIILDEDDAIWLLIRSGINKINKKGELRNYRIDEHPEIFFSSVLKVDANTLLIGTGKGLWEFNTNTKKFKQLSNIHGGIKGRINCLTKNIEDNSIWVGTKENGAFLIQADSVSNFSTKNGLLSDYITSFYKHKNSMWIGTKGGGVYRVSPSKIDTKYSIEKWTSINGLSSNEINDIIVNDTCAFLATNDGLNILDYKNYKTNLTPPPIFIEKLKVNNKDTILTSIYHFKYSENLIDIQLIGLAYKLAGKLRYKYRLYGKLQDTTWLETLNPNIQLSYLSPGSYLFQAKAINENNIESIEPVELVIEISEPFWSTWWFRALLLISVFSIIFLYLKRRLGEVKARNELEKEFLINKNRLEQEIEKFRQQALTQQMNPHFIFNSLNSIQLFVYKEDKKLSSKYLSKFSGLIRIILDNSQHQAISFQKEFDALVLYLELEEMRLQGKMSFAVQIDKKINTSYFTVPPLLIQPFVENSIWHGIVHKQGNGHVKVLLDEREDCFLCAIEDDGVGRKRAKEILDKKRSAHKSLGTQITEKRLELLYNHYGKKMNITYIDLYDKSIATGTRVEIEIPKVNNKNLD